MLPPLLTGCTLETDCTKTRIEAEEVRDLRAVTARLVTADGRPVKDRALRLGLRVPELSGNATVLGAVTAADGRVSLDLIAEAGRDPLAADYLPRLTAIQWKYRNPDALDAEAQPNYCSSEKLVEVVE